MKSKELFMLIDQIDRRFIEEAWEGDEESGKPIEIVLERSPFHAIKFAAAVAACIVLFGAGFFTIANIRTGEPFLPDSGAADSSGSPSEIVTSSDTSSDDISSESSYISEDTSPESSESRVSGGDGFDDFYETSDEIEKLGKHSFNVTVPFDGSVVIPYVGKRDNEGFGVIYVEDTNAELKHSIAASIWSVDGYGDPQYIVSEKVFIFERGKYTLKYTEPYEEGLLYMLVLEYDGLPDSKDKQDLTMVGSWSP